MTEILKKATTPKKPRAAANGAEPKKAAPRKRALPSNVTEMKRAASHDQIAMLAHRFWTERGGQHGHDAEDWFRAERELLGKAS